MKLIINSKQVYEAQHIENFTEEFECEIEKDINKISIKFDNGSIQIKAKQIIYERGENKIIIEEEKTNGCDYETQYGMFVLDIKGKSIENVVNPLEQVQSNEIVGIIAKACYEISMVGVAPYDNYIEIIIKE